MSVMPQDDAWKGEDLIRRRFVDGHGRLRRRGTCPVPGCADPVGRGNTTGVCRRHAHAPGLCRCDKCGGAA